LTTDASLMCSAGAAHRLRWAAARTVPCDGKDRSEQPANPALEPTARTYVRDSAAKPDHSDYRRSAGFLRRSASRLRTWL